MFANIYISQSGAMSPLCRKVLGLSPGLGSCYISDLVVCNDLDEVDPQRRKESGRSSKSRTNAFNPVD